MVNQHVSRTVYALLAGVAFVASQWGCNRSNTAGADNAPAVEGPRRIMALGRLEPAGGILEISAVPGDVLKEFAPGVKEGSLVEAGAELAKLGSYDLRATQLEAADVKLKLGRQQRDQELAVAQANYQQALAAKAEVDAKLEDVTAQGAVLESLAEAARIAQTDLDNLAALQASDPELVSDQQLRRKRNEADQAVNEHEVRARAHAAGYKAAYAAVQAAQENVRLAKLNLELAEDVDRNQVAEIERRVAEETLEQSVLRAPEAADGGSGKFTVLKTFMEPGEFVSQLPVLQLGDLSRMVCVAEVYEADVKEIVPGQEATIRSPAFAGRFGDGDVSGNGEGGIRGRVVRVGSLVSNAGLIQRNPLAPSDRSIVEVLIDITGKDEKDAAEATAEAARHIGMQVTVQFAQRPSGDEQNGATSGAAGDAQQALADNPE